MLSIVLGCYKYIPLVKNLTKLLFVFVLASTTFKQKVKNAFKRRWLKGLQESVSNTDGSMV